MAKYDKPVNPCLGDQTITIIAGVRITRETCWDLPQTPDGMGRVMPAPCETCGANQTPEGYDGCIGCVDGCFAACCGHGNVQQAYVAFGTSTRSEDFWELRGQAALDYCKSIGKTPWAKPQDEDGACLLA